jgi:hypothetical protein
MESWELVSIVTFWSSVDAQIAKDILDDVGIDSTITANQAGGMYLERTGVELLVSFEDAHEASEALHRRHRLPTM